jgi:hypothetical protein
LCWIDEPRTKLPRTLIASGKTDAIEEGRFSEVGSHLTDHSESGWMRQWRVLDCDSVHHREAMRQYAAELGIYLLSVPAGLAEERQPLDCFVFGAMKARSRQSVPDAYRQPGLDIEELEEDQQ